jgi:hypothetical protein
MFPTHNIFPSGKLLLKDCFVLWKKLAYTCTGGKLLEPPYSRKKSSIDNLSEANFQKSKKKSSINNFLVGKNKKSSINNFLVGKNKKSSINSFLVGKNKKSSIDGF